MNKNELIFQLKLLGFVYEKLNNKNHENCSYEDSIIMVVFRKEDSNMGLLVSTDECINIKTKICSKYDQALEYVLEIMDKLEI